MPNSLYAATALRDREFNAALCSRGPYGVRGVGIDRSNRFVPATAIVPDTKSDPRNRGNVGKRQVLDHDESGCKAGFDSTVF